MGRMRRFGAAAVLAGMMAAGLSMSTARLEAKGKPVGDITATCTLLKSTIANTTLNPLIRDAAQSILNFLQSAGYCL